MHNNMYELLSEKHNAGTEHIIMQLFVLNWSRGRCKMLMQTQKQYISASSKIDFACFLQSLRPKMLQVDASSLLSVDENVNANKKHFWRGRALKQSIRLRQALGRSEAADDGDYYAERKISQKINKRYKHLTLSSVAWNVAASSTSPRDVVLFRLRLHHL